MYSFTSDGGVQIGQPGACSLIIRDLDRQLYTKLLAVLGEVTPIEAELAGGILGLGFLRHCKVPPLSPTPWHCDSKVVVDTAAGISRFVEDDVLWKLFFELSQGTALEPKHIAGHQGHRDNEACDRACRWAIVQSEKLLSRFGEGPVRKTSHAKDYRPWHLIDARDMLTELRASGNTQQAQQQLQEKLSDVLRED